MRLLIEKIDALYTCDDRRSVLKHAWIVVENGKIAALGEHDSPDGDFDERIDLSGSIAMPGFVNAHHHFFQTLTRALPRAQRGQLMDWLRVLYPVWSAMSPDDLAAAAAASASELLLTGATTSVDHFYLVPRCDPSYVDAEVAAVRDAGLRLHLVRGSMTAIEGDLEHVLSESLGPRAGGIIDEPGPVLADMRRMIERYHDASDGSMLTVALGPTTPTYDDLGFLRAVAKLAAEAGVGIHMHVHPQDRERALCRKRFGRTPIEVLDGAGILGTRTWLAHATRLDSDDMALLADRGVGVAHCPRMILRLGARIPRIHDMIVSGMRVAVGVDGAASNDSGSMLGEMRLALLLHRLCNGGGEVSPDAWLTPHNVLVMATRVTADLIGRSDIGQITPGFCADITAFDMRGIGFAGARADLLSGLLLAGDDTRASLTMVAGRPLVRDGRLLLHDEHALREKVDRAAERLVAHMTSITGVDYCDFGGQAGH
ncbi:MAG: amidohydrolase family protein [Methylobacteriaceae bacterium]|nr:amidohydrolase family protein [Methylobacteriaceae bacterium]